MPDTVFPPAIADARVLWEVLTEDSGCAVFVASREGDILHANARVRAWMEARRAAAKEGDRGRPYTLDDLSPPALHQERSELVRRVCEAGSPVVFECLARSVRYLVTLRPVPAADRPGNVALIVMRRLRPWEHVTPQAFPMATVIEIEKHDPGVLATLSPRELDVLILIGEGMSSSDIAKRLHRSVRTIERHRDRLGQKLGVTNRVDIARFAIRAGLAELPEWPDAHVLSDKPHDPLDISEPLKVISRRRIRRAD